MCGGGGGGNILRSVLCVIDEDKEQSEKSQFCFQRTGGGLC